MRSHWPAGSLMLCLLWGGAGGCARSEPEITDWCAVPSVGDAPAVTPGDGGLIYEIYVRSFLDTDGDGVGDLAGVISKLDYLSALGVTTIWLMPVFESPSVGGYNPDSFQHVNPDYGSDEDLEELLEQASQRGIRVILDVALNQTSDTHPWFQAALDDPEGDAARRYLFSDVQWDEERWYKAAPNLYYYAFFGADHPDLNWADPEVPVAMAGALNGWLDRGVGGFRLDAVVQLIEEDDSVVNTEGSHCALAWLYRALKDEHPDALLLSEAWSLTVPENVGWLGSAEAPEADMVIDVPRRAAILAAFASGSTVPLLAFTAAQSELEDLDTRRAPYLDSHDLARLSTTVGDARAQRASLVVLMLSSGTPLLFYGDEIGLPDSDEEVEQDYPQRGPMLWDDTYNAGFTPGVPWFPVDQRYLDGLNVGSQQGDPESVWSLVSALGALRQSSAALREGALSWVPMDDSTLVMQRATEDEAVILVVNLSQTATITPSLPLSPDLGPWLDLTGGEVSSDAPGMVSLGPIEPLGYRLLAGPTLANRWVPGPVADDGT